MQKNHFLLLKIFKNTESAQLCKLAPATYKSDPQSQTKS